MKRAAIGLASLIIVLSSCQSVPTEIPEDLTQAELVQLAQEAADEENWEASLAYYEAVLERFPQDRAGVVSAQYEIAFIEYKRGDLDAAQAGFEQLLGVYDFDAAGLPQWPRVLGEKLLGQIQEERADLEATVEE